MWHTSTTIVLITRESPRPAAAPDCAAIDIARQHANIYPTHENNKHTKEKKKKRMSYDYHMIKRQCHMIVT